MFIFFVFIYVYWSKTWLYQLRILFYVCYLCIYLRLLVLDLVISVEDLALCLPSSSINLQINVLLSELVYGSLENSVFGKEGSS